MNAKALAATNKVFGEIDRIADEFYNQIQTKKIQIQTINDVERVQILFEKTLKELVKLIDGVTSYDKPIIQVIKARVIIDLHGRFGERYNLDLFTLVDKLGGYNKKQFEWALENINI